MVNFESAQRMDVKNEKLAASLATMREGAAQLAAMQATLEDIPDLCGTTCQEAALVRVRVRGRVRVTVRVRVRIRVRVRLGLGLGQGQG